MIPIFLGTVIYYLFSPDVFFVKSMDSITGLNFHMKILKTDSSIFKFVRNYFLDMLWAYALVTSLFFIIGNNTASVWRIFVITFSFSVIIEILQTTSAAKGTFDLCDIAVEFLAEIAAVFIIKKYFVRREEND